jgi:diadenosine tetraphosphatase ApaH/serine/threonine PP2A family protein phosphatase
MRYAVFTDIHANLEALEAVLAKIDELAKEKPIDQIWFLGDLVGSGPNPNECITKLRERTDVIIAGNHDWAAVGKIDLEDFSAAARISAEWTAEQLSEEHRAFLAELPERLEIDECTLVHGSPYGPLWEYLTSEVLAERSFQHFNSRYCFVGHTHVPVIFQQPDVIANAPTLPLVESDQNGSVLPFAEVDEDEEDEEYNDEAAGDSEETAQLAVIHPPLATSTMAEMAESAYADHETGHPINEAEANAMIEARIKGGETHEAAEPAHGAGEDSSAEDGAKTAEREDEGPLEQEGRPESEDAAAAEAEEKAARGDDEEEVSAEQTIISAEDRLNSEIEELLTLLGLSESMIQVTNKMLTPPEGRWDAPEGQRAIINPGGVGQPRDGDPRTAFMIFDSEQGFEFYRLPYAFNKTQEKIIKAGLPQYLAVRLAYGR